MVKIVRNVLIFILFFNSLKNIFFYFKFYYYELNFRNLLVFEVIDL